MCACVVCVLLGPQKQAGGGALWGAGSPLLALGYSVPVQEGIHGNPEGNPLRGWPRGLCEAGAGVTAPFRQFRPSAPSANSRQGGEGCVCIEGCVV